MTDERTIDLRPASLSLQALRDQRGVRRADLAERLGRSPQAVLQLERSLDPKVSSLRDFIRALADSTRSTAGDLRLIAEFDDSTYVIDIGSQTEELGEPATRPLGAWKIGAVSWFSSDDGAEMIRDGYIAMSEDEIDVSDHPTDLQLGERLRNAPRETAFGPDGRRSDDDAIARYVRYWRNFLTAVQTDDIVVLPMHDSNVAIGEITSGPYRNGDHPNVKLRHRRDVRWLVSSFSKSRLPDDLRRSIEARGTIHRIRAEDASRRLQALMQP